MDEGRYTYRDLLAAFQTGFSRGKSDARQPGPRPETGTVVDLAGYLIERAGRPCAVAPEQLCADEGQCLLPAASAAKW